MPSLTLGLLRYLRQLFLSIVKRCSHVPVLRYLFVLWNAIASRCKTLKCGASNSHTIHPQTSSPKTCNPSEEKESCSEGVNQGTTVQHVAFRDPQETPVIPGQLYEATIAAMEDGDAYRAQIHGANPTMSSGTHKCKPPLIEGNILGKLPSLFNMLFLLDHPGFIQRSLAATQVGGRSTDIRKWDAFSRTYREDIANVNLLGTVLLAANVSFLAIQTVDNAGLSYLPQVFSYISLLAALASIVMGSAVRIPRLFVSLQSFFVSFSHSCSIVSTMAQLFNLSSLAYLGHLCRPASLATG
ncbi:hypothetical protein SCLCIDRAFT_243919 [Scleroderma citrinum Foug A]|uniref:Uncharacterized protein n=1 Tax=Scleroderma citrinum Foug A TaxID=1036808 RepID=A0A0C3D6F2_9AGAM|nr:hypothetical protein SCLCIDRAFT_243919 [Scleroderma citrinum Foug A]